MRTPIIIIVLAILAVVVWLSFHRNPKTELPSAPPTNAPAQTSSLAPLPSSSSATNPPPNDSTTLVRPSSLDEKTWSKFLSYRQTRVLDQNDQPVEGAKLTVSVERLNEAVFVPTNYLHWDPALAFQKVYFELYSDANGWLQFVGTNGIMLDMTGLSKEGYLSAYPNGNFGGIHYEPNGKRAPSGDTSMTNAWNPQKGYILHLQKIR